MSTAEVVMTRGRRRILAASTTAFAVDRPFRSFSSLANVRSSTPSLTVAATITCLIWSSRTISTGPTARFTMATSAMRRYPPCAQ